ncbi:hypothetical protein Cgig2_005936 [Carnegiea gigantea]|uniref:PISTILLATA-like protein n=1 Tax=Carnegiea gigantea TaxID=171969 RepID=A0A9Q1KKB3_9CARY|nr:hypothetical protein Cgig2_005936 [Carnegiea gigantea]
MGRGKIEIKRIENANNRHVTYSKRRNGIIKKANEISVLCDAKVSLVIFGNTGKMHQFCSPSTSVPAILDLYQKHAGKRLWDAKHENLSNEIERITKENDDMQIELRHLKGEEITSLPIPDLLRLENALENGLDSIRQRKTRMLEEENSQLTYMLNKVEMMDGDLRDQMEQQGGGMCDNNPPDRDYNYQIPFGFRVQPMQPNLQDRM